MKFVFIAVATLALMGFAFTAGVAVAPILDLPRLAAPLAPSTPTGVPTPVISATPTIVRVQQPSDEDLRLAAQQAKFLTARYGVPEKEVDALNKQTYTLAWLYGATPEERAALHAQVLAFAENGGPGLRQFGIEGDDLSIAKKLGFNSERSLLAFTKPKLVEIRTLVATEGLASFNLGQKR